MNRRKREGERSTQRFSLAPFASPDLLWVLSASLWPWRFKARILYELRSLVLWHSVDGVPGNHWQESGVQEEKEFEFFLRLSARLDIRARMCSSSTRQADHGLQLQLSRF